LSAPRRAGRAEGEARLRDGSRVWIRAVEPRDEERLRELHQHMSAESRYLRYFTARHELPPGVAERFSHVDQHRRFGLIAESAGSVIAHACYESRPGSDRAEVAFTIDDAHQGLGLGTILLHRLARAARGHGIRAFTALVLPINERMLDVFRDAGFAETTRREPHGLIQVELGLDPWPAHLPFDDPPAQETAPDPPRESG